MARDKEKQAAPTLGTGTLILHLKDLNGQPAARKSTVIVTSAARGGQRYVAAGKDQQVTRFTFELPPGDYNVRVSCEGYKDARLLLSIQARVEREQVVVLRWERRSGKEGVPDGDGDPV